MLKACEATHTRRSGLRRAPARRGLYNPLPRPALAGLDHNVRGFRLHPEDSLAGGPPGLSYGHSLVDHARSPPPCNERIKSVLQHSLCNRVGRPTFGQGLYGMPTQLLLLTLQTKGLKFVVYLILGATLNNQLYTLIVHCSRLLFHLI